MVDSCREAFEKWFQDKEKPKNSQSFNSLEKDEENPDYYLMKYTDDKWIEWKQIWNASHDRCVEIADYELWNYNDPEDIVKAIQNDKVEL